MTTQDSRAADRPSGPAEIHSGPTEPAQPLVSDARVVEIRGDATASTIIAGDNNRIYQEWIRFVPFAGRDELDILIGAQLQDGSSPISVWSAVAERPIAGSFRIAFTDAELAHAWAWLERGAPNGAPVREFGAQLFGALFSGGVGEAYEDFRRTDRAGRLRLVLPNPLHQAVPWELLYAPIRGELVSRAGSIVRASGREPPARAPQVRPPVARAHTGHA